ncbi:MAG: PAS domain-containing protein, partial [Azonexus sp.]|nr:PAS domain-containing protein [Azonexus sp.]
MDALTLNPDFLTGEPAIDDEHRALVDVINALVDAEQQAAPATVSNALMDQLIELSRSHFAHEEAWMRAGRCADEFLNKHIAAHTSFIEQLSRTREAMAAGGDFRHLINFLTRWATHHILGMDQSAARQIRLIQQGHDPRHAYFEQRPPANEVPTASMLDAMSSLYRIIAERNDALDQANQRLESQVQARTEALSESNRQLRAEHQALRDAIQALESTQKRLLESEHKRANEARRHLQFFLSQIIDGDPVPTLVIDAEHRITHWNKACATISGLQADDMIGTREQWRAFYPEVRPILADLIVDGAMEAHFDTYYHNIFRRSNAIADAFEAERFFPHLGEEGRWLFFTAAPIRDAEGHIIGAIETLQDVTERHRAEDALRSHQEQLEAQVAART